MMHVREREQGEVIYKIGDIFLNAAAEFRSAYSTYVSRLQAAEERLKEEMEGNGELRMFLEVYAGGAIDHWRLTFRPPKQCSHHLDNTSKMSPKEKMENNEGLRTFLEVYAGGAIDHGD